MIRIFPKIEECMKTSREICPTVLTDDKYMDERLKVIEKLYVTDTELRNVVEDVEKSFETILNATPRVSVDMGLIEKKIDEMINKRIEIIDNTTVKKIVPKLNIKKKP
jgi:hypothetical protein